MTVEDALASFDRHGHKLQKNCEEKEMIVGGITRYLKQLGGFGRNARFYLLSELVIGLSFSIYTLIFNLYVDSAGYSRSFLGQLQSLPNLVALFGAIPAGMLVDRIGRKPALLLANLGSVVAKLGIVLAPDAGWLRVSTIGFGVANSLWMVSASPFMMENSTDEERNALFSAHFGLTTLIGFLGTLVGGYLPAVFGDLLRVDVESPQAYAAVLMVTVILSALSMLPLLFIREQPQPVRTGRPSLLPWRNLTNPGLALRIFMPNIVISLGASILMPYMNLFFKETFAVSDRVLGSVFAVSSVITGTATLASPILADRWGRIRSLTATQLLSIPFLLTIGFSPVLSLAVPAYWVRAALMNLGSPLYEAFAMEQFAARERATISGLIGMSWTIGWSVGPYVSGFMQQNPDIGFRPIFLLTCGFYLLAVALEKGFFQQMDDRQRRSSMLTKPGIHDVTASAAIVTETSRTMEEK